MNAIVYRQLAMSELHRLGEIDRTEYIPAIYRQQGDQLTEEHHDFNVPP